MVDTLRQRGTAGQNLMAVLGMHAGMPVRRVEITGTRDDVSRQAYQDLEDLQPIAFASDAGRRKAALKRRMLVIEAELKQAGVSLDDKVRSWSLLLDASATESSALAMLAPETQGAIAAERIRLAVPTPGSVIPVNISVNSYSGKVLRFLKAPGFIAPVAAIFAVLGLGNALEEERKALKDEQGRALATLVAAYAGLGTGAFEVIKVSVEGAAKRRLPLLGPIAEALSGRFLRFVAVGGARAGALGMLIATTVGVVNARKAWKEGEAGMVTFYIVRGGMEGVLTTSLGWSLRGLLIDGVAAELFGGPVVWIITGFIVVVSVVIELTKDPETLKWSKHSYFGAISDYNDDSTREQTDFRTAITN